MGSTTEMFHHYDVGSVPLLQDHFSNNDFSGVRVGVIGH